MKTKPLKYNAILNVIKQICTISFPLITIPYVTRMIGIEGYGQFSYANSIVSYFILIAGLGFNTYAIREGSKVRNQTEHFEELANNVFTLNIITASISFVALLLILEFVGSLAAYKCILAILSLNIITNTLGADWINTIYEDFTYITIRYIVIQIISLVALFIFVRKGSSVIIYTWIYLFSQCASNIFNIFYIRRYIRLKINRISNVRRILIPVLMLFFNNLAITVYVNSDITILGFFRSDNEVGIYSLASKIYLSAKMLANAATVVAIPRLAAYIGENNWEKYKSLLINVLSMVLSISVPLFVGLFMLSKEAIILISGTTNEGYITLQILCIASIFSILAYFCAQCILIPNNDEKYFLYSTVIGAFTNLFLNILIIPNFGYNGAAFTTLLSEFIVLLICNHFSRKKIRISIETKTIFFTVGMSLLIIIVCYIGRNIASLVIRILFDIVVSGVLYLMLTLTNSKRLYKNNYK